MRINHKYAWALSLALVAVGIYEYTLFKNEKEDNFALKEALGASEGENARLELELRDKLYIIESFNGQISSISNVVGDLTKLAATDKELLRKYSKIYFLNENYTPSRLAEVDKEYAYNVENGAPQVYADIAPFLEGLLLDARRTGVELLVTSAYRSYGEQASIKTGYKILYGAGTANQFSADQGYSEHQLGTTVDFATRASGPASRNFETDPAFDWLGENAHKYGFTLSYPKGNSYYIFEPWHWRFVGVELATSLHDEGKHFYDLDQREIDSYLIKLFN